MASQKTNVVSSSSVENTPPTSPGAQPLGSVTSRLHAATLALLQQSLPNCVHAWLRSPEGGQPLVRECLEVTSSASLQAFREEFARRMNGLEERLASAPSGTKSPDTVSVSRGRSWRIIKGTAVVVLVVLLMSNLTIQIQERAQIRRSQTQIEELEAERRHLIQCLRKLKQQKQKAAMELRDSVWAQRIVSLRDPEGRLWVQMKPGTQQGTIDVRGTTTVWILPVEVPLGPSNTPQK
ncbi:MAG: hypothetical protein HZA32_16765 [Opitutae bacterium]|nr:hypothetical protein [Opitutae bacterium]